MFIKIEFIKLTCDKCGIEYKTCGGKKFFKDEDNVCDKATDDGWVCGEDNYMICYKCFKKLD